MQQPTAGLGGVDTECPDWMPQTLVLQLSWQTLVLQLSWQTLTPGPR
jgi:hypothetical protein